MKRIQVSLDEEEHQGIQRAARAQGLTVEEWVRQALLRAADDHRRTVDAKLRAIAHGSRHQFPTADIDDMLRETTSGHQLP